MRNLEKTNNVVLKGDYEKAVYKPQLLPEYENNPFLEALPPIFNEDDVLDRFMVTPRISKEDKQKDINIRYHVLKRVKNFIQPLPIHFEVERRLSTLMRRGYLARNPLDKTFFERLKVLHELREDEEQAHKYIDDRLNYIRSTADSLSIIGISGIGKTTAIERLLLMYPQVIKHDIYKGQPFNRTQIVWLKIDCPYDGSLSTLCKSFLKAIDDLLGTRYLEKFGYLNRVTSTMLLHMTSLASMYGIGVLVIDEIQHLLHAKNDQEEMLNFFVTLSNTVGIPTVLIGTSKAQQLFKGNFRQARRAASDGAIIWDRMDEDSEEWEFFLETLWKLQCLKTRSELTEDVKKSTQYEGKVRAAMKERQNTLEYKRKELIEGLSLEAASLGIFDSLSSTDILKATEKIVEDTPVDTDEIALKSQLITYLIAMNDQVKKSKKSTVTANKILPLLVLREQALKQKRHSYELLDLNGYIKKVKEFY